MEPKVLADRSFEAPPPLEELWAQLEDKRPLCSTNTRVMWPLDLSQVTDTNSTLQHLQWAVGQMKNQPIKQSYGKIKRNILNSLIEEVIAQIYSENWSWNIQEPVTSEQCAYMNGIGTGFAYPLTIKTQIKLYRVRSIFSSGVWKNIFFNVVNNWMKLVW